MSEEIATLGGGCFWCLEAVYKELRGVRGVMSGYAGGHVANPSYHAVCTGTTGHAEVVQIKFDPAEVSYADLLRVSFTIHDQITKDRQVYDVGPQYRSIIPLTILGGRIVDGEEHAQQNRVRHLGRIEFDLHH